MIPKAQRDADRAVCEATTGGEWIAVQPRSQEGGEVIASFGPSWHDTFPAETHLRMAGASRPLTWGEHADNARFAVVAHERMPAYIAALDTLDARMTEIATRLATAPVGADEWDRGRYHGLAEAFRILRGEK